jgi:hypothetical protein
MNYWSWDSSWIYFWKWVSRWSHKSTSWTWRPIFSKPLRTLSSGTKLYCYCFNYQLYKILILNFYLIFFSHEIIIFRWFSNEMKKVKNRVSGHLGTWTSQYWTYETSPFWTSRYWKFRYWIIKIIWLNLNTFFFDM